MSTKKAVRQVPFDAWRLLPGFGTQKVTVVKAESYFGGNFYETDKGKTFREENLFDSEKAAIDIGFQRLGDQEAHIKKLQAGVAKKRKALLAAQAKMVNAEMAKAGDP